MLVSLLSLLAHSGEKEKRRKIEEEKIFCFSVFLFFSFLLVVPGRAAALTVQQIATLKPISTHYVQRVLDRAEAGIAYAKNAPLPTQFDAPYWLKRVTSASLRLVDMSVRIKEEARDLLETTPCLHSDLLLLEVKMEKVRVELDAAWTQKNYNTIVKLESLLKFLSDRYENLIKGGRDPYFVDTGWERVYAFDDPNPVWCCPKGIPGNTCKTEPDEDTCTFPGGQAFQTLLGCEQYGCLAPSPRPAFIEKDKPMCPFHSDYLPPTTAGYGCDIEALDKAAGGNNTDSIHGPSLTESGALGALIAARNAFIETGKELPYIDIQLKEFLGDPYDEGNCGLKPSMTLEEYSNYMQCQYPQYFGAVPASYPLGYENFGYALRRKHQALSGCIWEGRTDDIPAEGLLYSVGATTYEMRGPFSLSKNQAALMSRFYELVRSWGNIRPQADRLKFPNEFPEGQERDDALEREKAVSFTSRVFREFERMFFLVWNRAQSKKESLAIAKGQDAQLQMHRILYPELRTAGKELTEAANKIGFGGDDKGIRGFTRDFAVFLRASCVFRPCNRKLEQIIAVILHDECFPYANGSFQGNPDIAKACKDAVERELDKDGDIEIEDDL